MAPHVLHQPLQHHLRAVREQHEADLGLGLGRAPLPDALVRKYPNADREWAWQWVFPASSHYLDRRTGVEHRHHVHESAVQKAIREAAMRFTAPSTACASVCQSTAAGRCGPTARPETGEVNWRIEAKLSWCKQLPTSLAGGGSGVGRPGGSYAGQVEQELSGPGGTW